jgi:hypothetical protein
MAELLANFLATLLSLFKSRSELQAEIFVLRHQLNVLRRKARHRPRVTSWDRLLFVWLYRLYPSALAAVAIIEPDTLIRLSLPITTSARSGDAGRRPWARARRRLVEEQHLGLKNEQDRQDVIAYLKQQPAQ